MSSDQPRTLKSVFDDADSKRAVLESRTDTTSTSYREELAIIIGEYETILGLSKSLSLFSINETLDDIATSDLPYLLTNYHLAELLSKSPTASPHDRLEVIKSTRAAYESFLTLLDNYGLLKGPYRTLYARYTEDPLTFSVIATKDAAARREAKITNFREEKRLRERLAYLRQSPQYLERADEEAVRNVYLTHIDFCTHGTFQNLESLAREVDVLSQFTKDNDVASQSTPGNTALDSRFRQREGGARNPQEYSERLDQPLNNLRYANGPLLSREGKPVRPFTLVKSRQEIRKDVFRPGHNLPTMSIDEYLDEEYRRGNIIEGGGEASFNRPEPNEDDIEKADEETMKAREWDEFVEANPKGAGNTLNRG
jgi:immunoglobulin-binding protein 1